MCSIVMPADYEMLVSHSPPIFSHSPPTSFLAARYDYHHPTRFNNHRTALITAAKHAPPAIRQRPPILIHSPTQNSKKKKVVFADDRGMSLTHVKIMTEPSNVPPVWSLRFLAQVTQGVNADPIGNGNGSDAPSWRLQFAQPASNYLEFRKQLEANKVCLENVIVKDHERVITGTVKVCNLGYEKCVFIRSSSDKWQTHIDTDAHFVVSSTANNVYVLYDTFEFKLALDVEAQQTEFCVCFRCNGTEYWDNNQQRNYIIEKQVQEPQQRRLLASSSPDANNNHKVCDALQAKMDSWSEFASWTHLDTATPYW